MAEAVRFAAASVGSFWWEGGLLLKRAIAPYGVDLVLDDKTNDFNNVLSVARGKNQIGITSPNFLDWSQRKLGIFATEPIPELCVLAAVNLPRWLAAAVDRSTGFTELADIARHRYPWRVVMPGGKNQTGIFIERILSEHGITRASIRDWGGTDMRTNRERTAEEEAARVQSSALSVMGRRTAEIGRNAEANGFFLYITAGSDWARDLTTFLDLRFLRFDQAALDRVTAELGGTTILLPARAFPGVDEDIPVIGWRHQYIYGSPDTPDELVTTILHALEDERVADNAHGITFTALRPLLGTTLQLHCAADAYYRAHERRSRSSESRVAQHSQTLSALTS